MTAGASTPGASLVVQGAAELSAAFTCADVGFTVRLRQMPYGEDFYVRDADGAAAQTVKDIPPSKLIAAPVM
jgi:hypothetical protein